MSTTAVMFLPTIAYYPQQQFPPNSVYRRLLFMNNAQGKVAELRAELNAPSGKKDKSYLGKKIALKKIVANMTMSNNDMVALFPDIIEVMGLQSLEIKKM